MLTIERTAEVEAIPDQVWGALTDFGAYAAWTPFLRVDGEEGLLEPIVYRFRIKYGAKRGTKTDRFIGFPGRIVTYEPARELVFMVGFPALLRLRIEYRIEALGNRTRLRHAIMISGVAQVLARKRYERVYTAFVEGALGALQRRFGAKAAVPPPSAARKRKPGPRTRRSRS